MKFYPKLDYTKKLAHSVSGTFNWVAGIAMVVMVLFSAADFIGAKLFQSPFAGTLEICGLLGLVIVSFSIPFTQILHGHTEIDFVTRRLHKRAQAVIAGIVSIFGLAIFVLMTWQMYDYGRTVQVAGGVTAMKKIPLAPFAYATAVCFLLMCAVLLVALIRLVREGSKNGS